MNLKQSAYGIFRSLFFDPAVTVSRWRALPYFLSNLRAYRRLNGSGAFAVRAGEMIFTAHDRFGGAGKVDGHYFLQDLWAARFLFDHGVRDHVDVGSRLDGFVASILTFCRVTYIDLRPLAASVAGLEFRQGSLTALPLGDESVTSLSCLHVIEHVGLGRYGDAVDPEGHLMAAAELTRVLAPGGRLLIGTPVGRERLCFDAHRVFDPGTVLRAFSALRLQEFSLIDSGKLMRNADFDATRQCDYACGLFVFAKGQGEQADR